MTYLADNEGSIPALGVQHRTPMRQSSTDESIPDSPLTNRYIMRLLEDSMGDDHPKTSPLLLSQVWTSRLDPALKGVAALKYPRMIRKQNISVDVCETLTLCAECYIDECSQSEKMVTRRLDALLDRLVPVLIDHGPEWSLDVWESLWLCMDIVGFPIRLVTNMIEYALTAPTIYLRNVENALRILRSAPYRTTPAAKQVKKMQIEARLTDRKGPEKRDNPKYRLLNTKQDDGSPMLSSNDLHMGLERLTNRYLEELRQGITKSSYLPTTDTIFHCYVLMQMLVKAKIVNPYFLVRLPFEFLAVIRDCALRCPSEARAHEVDSEYIEDLLDRMKVYKECVSEFITTTEFFRNDAKIDETTLLTIYSALEDMNSVTSLGMEEPLSLRHEFVRQLCVATCAETSKYSVRSKITITLDTMAQLGVLVEDEIQIGLERFLSRIDDLLIDHPSIDVSLSAFLLNLLIENVISMNVVENWVRLGLGGTHGASILRRVCLWIDRRLMQYTDSSTLKMRDINIFEIARQKPRPNEINHVFAEIEVIVDMLREEALKVASTEELEQLCTLAAEDIERSCNMFDHSSHLIVYNIISHFGVPKPMLQTCCLYLIRTARRKRYFVDSVIKDALQEYRIRGSTIDNDYQDRTTRDRVVDTLERELSVAYAIQPSIALRATDKLPQTLSGIDMSSEHSGIYNLNQPPTPTTSSSSPVVSSTPTETRPVGIHRPTTVLFTDTLDLKEQRKQQTRLRAAQTSPRTPLLTRFNCTRM